MKAQQLNSPALSTVIDLEQVRAGSACPPLAVHVHHAGSWTILEVDGEVDIQTRALITNLVGSHASRVVFETFDSLLRALTTPLDATPTPT